MIAKPKPRRRTLHTECLESRRYLAVSVGWDGPGLGSADLSYYISTVPASIGLDQATVDAVFEKALDIWASVADISFTETAQANQSNSIDFSFRSIDGRGGALAQAYFPNDRNRGSIAGDVQIDLAETWEVGNSRGGAAFDLLYVTVHELGHSLGLDHSTVVGSVMYASVSATTQFVALAAADIVSIQQLYAPAKPISTPPADPTPTPPTNPAPAPPVNPTPPAIPTPPVNPTPIPAPEPPLAPPTDTNPTPPTSPTPPTIPTPELPGEAPQGPPTGTNPTIPHANPKPTPPSHPTPVPPSTAPETPTPWTPVARHTPWVFWNFAFNSFAMRWWQQYNAGIYRIGTYQITLVNGNGIPLRTFRITVGLPAVRFF